MTVVQAVLDEELSLREAAARFNISNESVVRHWVNVYKDASEQGLLNMRLDCLYLKPVAITDVKDEENDADDQIALIEKGLLMNSADTLLAFTRYFLSEG